MPDASALLAAIASNPDDDLPRLVYADWLDEHGDPDRAEFIRLQCHTARVGPLDPTWAPAKLREFDLFKANEKKWCPATVSQEGRYLLDRWRRGFPASVMLDDVAEGRLTNGEWANGVYDWSAGPNRLPLPWPSGGQVREVLFSGWEEGCDRLFWQERLRGVRTLSLTEWYGAVSPRMLESFVGDLSLLPPGHFPDLTGLHLREGELDLSACETLADSAVVYSLTALSLRFPQYLLPSEAAGWRGAAQRLFAAVGPRLESLALENPPHELLRAFAATAWPRLKSFDLTAASAGDIITVSAARLPRIERLNVRVSPFTTLPVWTYASVEHLTRWPALGSLKDLTVSGLTTSLLRPLIGSAETSKLVSLAVFRGRAAVSELPFSELTGREAFDNLKNLRGSFTHGGLTPLAEPDLLPELHTIWSDDTEPLTGLRWRGGARTVIPKDPPDSGRVRPSRGSWCGG